MEVHNRHLKPKPGGYFSQATAVTLQSPLGGGPFGTRTTVAAAGTLGCSGQGGGLGGGLGQLGAGNNGGLFRARNSMGDDSNGSSASAAASAAASAEALGSVTGGGGASSATERSDRV